MAQYTFSRTQQEQRAREEILKRQFVWTYAVHFVKKIKQQYFSFQFQLDCVHMWYYAYYSTLADYSGGQEMGVK
jgi:hypothetical protein